MAVIKTLKGHTVITVVCNIVYDEPKNNNKLGGDVGAKEEELLMERRDIAGAMEEALLAKNSHRSNLDRNIALLLKDRGVKPNKDMASVWRVMGFFMVVFVLPVLLIAIPLYARYTLYPTRTLSFMPTDTMDLHTISSSFWCQGQRVSGNGSFEAYLLSHVPAIDSNRKKITSVTTTMTISEEQPEVTELHLLKGSTFRLRLCARWPGSTVIIVRGKHNFKRCYYKENRDWDDTLEEEEELRRAKEAASEERKYPSRLSTIPHLKQTLSEETNKPLSVLRPTNEDVFQDEVQDDDNGGEVFSLNDTPSDKLSKGEKESQNDFNTLTRKTKDNEDSPIEDNLIGEEVDLLVLKDKPLRTVRSAVYRDDVDGSDEHRLREEEEMRLLGLLHSVNDTRDVTAGNSSISSSEEFMEQCTNTIVYTAPKVYRDCQARNLTEENEYSVKINATDVYYIILMSDNSLEENVLKYILDMERVMYNVTDNMETCSNSSECIFPISFLSSEGVVLEVDDDGTEETEVNEELSSVQMLATCQPRVSVYMAFILLVPFIILLFAFQ